MCNPYNHLPLSLFCRENFDLVLIISVIYNTNINREIMSDVKKFFFIPHKLTLPAFKLMVFHTPNFLKGNEKSERKYTYNTGKRRSSLVRAVSHLP